MILYPGPGAQNLEDLLHNDPTAPEETEPVSGTQYNHTGPGEPEEPASRTHYNHTGPEETEPPSRTHYNVIIIDGTWSQAKDMFLRNTLLHLPKQVL